MDYASIATSVLSLLSEYGRSFTLRRVSASSFNSTTLANTTTSTDTTVMGVMTEFGAGQTHDQGTLIQGGDRRLVLGASVEPMLQDRILDGSVEYVVVAKNQVKPGDTALAYILHLRT